MPGNKSAILVLISLLVVALIFSSTSRFYVFGKSVVVNSQCHSSSDLKSKTCCYTNYNAQNGAYFTTCIDCEISKVSGNWECGKEYYVATPPSALSPPDNNTSPPPLSHPIPPPSAGTAQPPSSPPATPPSNALLPPSTSQQTTCPDGSAPDTNGNCPSTSTTNQQIAPNQNLASNNLQPEHHHHKGSNLPGKESTSKKDNGGGSDQGTQPPS
jgi:hypothetical protein